jgi:hypothetical protein
LYFPFTICAPLEGTSLANRFDLPANRGNMAGTRRKRFLLSAVYDVLVGQNRKFLSHMNRISDLALGGWSVSTVSLWETGPYLTPTISSSFDPGNLNLSFRGSLQRPDCIGNGNVANAGTGTCSTLLRSIRFLKGQREIAVWESWRGLAPLRSRLGCPKLSISRNGRGCALKARYKSIES